MKRHANFQPKRLGLASALSLIVCFTAAPVASAEWMSAGNNLIHAQEETSFACLDGVQVGLAENGGEMISGAELTSFVTTHPWAWAKMRVSMGPALPPFVDPSPLYFADEVVVLPRNPVDVSSGWVRPYSGVVQIRYTGVPASWYVRLWPTLFHPPNATVPAFGFIGTSFMPLQAPAPDCVDGLLPPPPVEGRCLGGRNPIGGTQGDDDIVGTPDNDVIVGLGGDDVIDGLGGDDRICGGPGDDVISGGFGNDGLEGGGEADVLAGGFGNDLALGGAGGDTLTGSFGDDILKGEADNDILVGGPLLELQGFDPLDGGPGTDTCLRGQLTVACE